MIHAAIHSAGGSSPRMRGTLTLRSVNNNFNGSSPRMRGTHVEEHDPHARRRFIPAHAGNSDEADAAEMLRRRFIPAHAGNSKDFSLDARTDSGSSPRMRGTPQRTLYSIGSSPRMRGTPPVHACDEFLMVKPRSVHPRACGELSS